MYFSIKVAQSSLGEGTTIPNVSSALRQNGQPFEEVWRYNKISDFSDYGQPKDAKPLFYAEGKYSKFNLDEIVEFLDRDYPIVITLSIDRTFRCPRTEGDLAIFEQKSVLKNHLLHAVLVVGYGKYKGRRYLKVRNSWGKYWGIDGHAWICEDFLSSNALAMLWLQKVDNPNYARDCRFCSVFGYKS